MAFGNATKGYVRAHSSGGGGGGTSDYSQLSNKPSINGVSLIGNKTSADLNISSGGITFEDKIADITTGISLGDITSGILLVSVDSSSRRISGMYTKADIINNTEYVFGYSNEYCNSKFIVSDNTLTIQHVSGNNLTHVYVF